MTVGGTSHPVLSRDLPTCSPVVLPKTPLHHVTRSWLLWHVEVPCRSTSLNRHQRTPHPPTSLTVHPITIPLMIPWLCFLPYDFRVGPGKRRSLLSFSSLVWPVKGLCPVLFAHLMHLLAPYHPIRVLAFWSGGDPPCVFFFLN